MDSLKKTNDDEFAKPSISFNNWQFDQALFLYNIYQHVFPIVSFIVALSGVRSYFAVQAILEVFQARAFHFSEKVVKKDCSNVDTVLFNF